MITDREVEQLLELIDKACDPENSGDSAPYFASEVTLEDFVEGLAMSMDPTTDKADRHRANIQANLL